MRHLRLIVTVLLLTSSGYVFTVETPGLGKLQYDAEQGDASAQYKLGRMYANGEGVPRNDTEAVNWFRKAAEQGLADAPFRTISDTETFSILSPIFSQHS